MTEAIIEDTTLAGLVQALVEALHPEKIPLFGSAARDQAGPDSDIDLFIEMADGLRSGLQQSPPRCTVLEKWP